MLGARFGSPRDSLDGRAGLIAGGHLGERVPDPCRRATAPSRDLDHTTANPTVELGAADCSSTAAEHLVRLSFEQGGPQAAEVVPLGTHVVAGTLVGSLELEIVPTGASGAVTIGQVRGAILMALADLRVPRGGLRHGGVVGTRSNQRSWAVQLVEHERERRLSNPTQADHERRGRRVIGNGELVGHGREVGGARPSGIGVEQDVDDPRIRRLE